MTSPLSCLQNTPISQGRPARLCYGHAPVRGHLGRLAPLVVVAAVGAAATLSTPRADGARSPSAEPRATVAALERAEQRALLDLYASESALATAQQHATELERRSLALAAREASTRELARISRMALAASRARIADTLRALYIEGEPDPVAVILGAESLDALVAGVEGLQFATRRSRGLAEVAAARQAHLGRTLERLARERAELDATQRSARAATTALAAQRRARTQVVADIGRRLRVGQARLAELERQAREARRLSDELQERPIPEADDQDASAATARPIVPAEPVATDPAGERTLVVDAVAYHLPGRTASGLPVGVGVIAVDPAVIPLGTRVFVPGYGPAVAADVGSAIRGNIIDLWMPSTRDALAWGRRTVTITVYG